MTKIHLKIIIRDLKKFAYLSDPPQYLDREDLYNWMAETRDDDPEIYAQLVPIYFQLIKPLPQAKSKIS